jgi:GNAT superfamily N-acetyltransferase
VTAQGVVVFATDTAPLQAQAHALVVEYLHWLVGIAKARHGLNMDAEAMIRSDLDEAASLAAPHGARLIANIDGVAVGVGGFRVLSPGVVELRRMYVRPGARHQGVGRGLLNGLLDLARQLGQTTVRLETLKSLHAAQALYRAGGFRDVEPYRDHWSAFRSASFAAAYRRAVVSMEARLTARVGL